MTVRTCRVCHVEKPLTEFAEYNHDGGRRHECKPCMNERRLKYFDSEWVVEKARVKVHNLTIIYAGPNHCWVCRRSVSKRGPVVLCKDCLNIDWKP